MCHWLFRSIANIWLGEITNPQWNRKLRCWACVHYSLVRTCIPLFSSFVHTLQVSDVYSFFTSIRMKCFFAAICAETTRNTHTHLGVPIINSQCWGLMSVSTVVFLKRLHTPPVCHLDFTSRASLVTSCQIKIQKHVRSQFSCATGATLALFHNTNRCYRRFVNKSNRTDRFWPQQQQPC